MTVKKVRMERDVNEVWGRKSYDFKQEEQH